MSNYNGGLFEAKNQFLKDLQNDEDFLEHKNYESVTYLDKYYHGFNPVLVEQGVFNEEVRIRFGTVSIASDIFIREKSKVNNLIKKYIRKL